MRVDLSVQPLDALRPHGGTRLPAAATNSAAWSPPSPAPSAAASATRAAASASLGLRLPLEELRLRRQPLRLRRQARHLPLDGGDSRRRRLLVALARRRRRRRRAAPARRARRRACLHVGWRDPRRRPFGLRRRRRRRGRVRRATPRGARSSPPRARRRAFLPTLDRRDPRRRLGGGLRRLLDGGGHFSPTTARRACASLHGVAARSMPRRASIAAATARRPHLAGSTRGRNPRRCELSAWSPGLLPPTRPAPRAGAPPSLGAAVPRWSRFSSPPPPRPPPATAAAFGCGAALRRLPPPQLSALRRRARRRELDLVGARRLHRRAHALGCLSRARRGGVPIRPSPHPLESRDDPQRRRRRRRRARGRPSRPAGEPPAAAEPPNQRARRVSSARLTDRGGARSVAAAGAGAGSGVGSGAGGREVTRASRRAAFVTSRRATLSALRRGHARCRSGTHEPLAEPSLAAAHPCRASRRRFASRPLPLSARRGRRASARRCGACIAE